MNEETYDIQELVDRSGVARRNIYFYVQQGLLPPPSGAGLGARYGAEHLARLNLIPLLRRQGLRLDQIRERFARSSAAEIDAALTGPGQPPAPQPFAPPPAVRPPAGRACTRYDLPGGIILIVPAGLNPAQHAFTERLSAWVEQNAAALAANATAE